MVTLKKAGQEDCQTIFQWRNHPKVREHFFDVREITYSEHSKWFEESLQRNDRIILIAYDGPHAVGVIRFDVVKTEPKEAEIDIYVAPELLGQGFGKKILAEAENWNKKNLQVKSLIARVKEENQASVKMFKWSGFKSIYIQLRKNLGPLKGL